MHIFVDEMKLPRAIHQLLFVCCRYDMRLMFKEPVRFHTTGSDNQQRLANSNYVVLMKNDLPTHVKLI